MKSKRGIKPFLGISVLFILFLSINYYYNHTVLKKALDKYEQEIFYKVRLKINDWTKSNFENVNKMAKIIEDEQLLEEDELSNLLNRLQKNSNFPYIILGTSNGEFYISDKEFITPYNYSPTNRDWFKDAQKEGKTISTKPYYSMRLGLRSVSICTPIEVFGKKSVFCGGQPFKFITDYFVEYASLYNKNIYLLDQDGEILNKIGQTNTLNFEQKNYVKFPVENTRWEIVFEKDNKIYQEHMGEFFIINLLFYAIFVFVYFFTNIFWFKQNKNTNEQIQEQANFIKNALTNKSSSILITCDDDFNIISKEIDNFYDIFGGTNLKENILNSNFIENNDKEKFLQSNEQYYSLAINKKEYLITKSRIDSNINFLFQETQKKSKIDDYDNTMDKVLLFVYQNLSDETLCVDKLAKIGSYSKFHFQRVFKNYTGQSLATYLRLLRLNRAKFLLSYSDESISNIAYSCGFAHIESFNRAFNKEFNTTPTNFKELDRKRVIEDKLYYEEIVIEKLTLAITFNKNSVDFLKNSKKYFIVKYSQTLFASQSSDADINLENQKFIKIDFKYSKLSLENILHKIFTVFYDYKQYKSQIPIVFYTKNELNQIDFIYINTPV